MPTSLDFRSPPDIHSRLIGGTEAAASTGASCAGSESNGWAGAVSSAVREVRAIPFDDPRSPARQSQDTTSDTDQRRGGTSVNPVAECTVPEKILLAAHKLEQDGESPFSAEALIVAAWQKFPKTFGLKGFADQYPDSNKVLSSIMGVKGLANRGWLVKMGQKLYSLTREGRQVVKHLVEGEEPTPSKRTAVRLSREQEKFLLRQFETSAAEKFSEGRKPELTFADACRFWDINDGMNAEAVNGRLSRLRAHLADIERVLEQRDTELSNGRYVSADDISRLTEVHHYLEERFIRHLNLLRSRAER
jgi:hypothetical protein